MFINKAADRGTQATFWHDDVEYSVLNNPFWGEVEFNTAYDKHQEGGIGAEWNSGELVQILVTDGDMNLDARTKDQMKVKANNTIVPAIKIGSPITLASLDTLHFYDHVRSINTAGSSPEALVDENIAANSCSSDYSTGAASYVSCYEKYSERAIVTVSNSTVASYDEAFDDGDELRFRYGDGTNQYTSVQDLKDMIANANGTAAYTLSLIHI